MKENALPRTVRRVLVPPLKCQGIKTKLVPFIARSILWNGKGRWIEPFLGSGVVAFNIAPKRAMLADSNLHIVRLYCDIAAGKLTEDLVFRRLNEMGSHLKRRGGEYFYEVRERFNAEGDPIDMLFLNRSCFNGIMRFNRKGLYNVPFGKKVERFRQAYITKICNQVRWVRLLLQHGQFEFRSQDWKLTLAEAEANDFVYVDPPYIGRHTDYFSHWSNEDAQSLARCCAKLPCGYALSMWKSNKYRENHHIDLCWSGGVVRTFTHFYHVGPTETLRNEMTEALVIKQEFAAHVCECSDGIATTNDTLIQRQLYD
jgi:DNA adenine methylase